MSLPVRGRHTASRCIRRGSRRPQAGTDVKAMTERMAQSSKVHQHGHCSTGFTGEGDGVFRKGVGEAASIGGIGDDVFGQRFALSQEVALGFTEAVVNEIGAGDLVASSW